MIHQTCFDKNKTEEEINWTCMECRTEKSQPDFSVNEQVSNMNFDQDLMKLENKELMILLIKQQKGVLNCLNFLVKKYNEWHNSLSSLKKMKDDNERLTKRIQEIEDKLAAIAKVESVQKFDNTVNKNECKQKIIGEKVLKENSEINKLEVKVDCHSENVTSCRGKFSKKKKLQQSKSQDNENIVNSDIQKQSVMTETKDNKKDEEECVQPEVRRQEVLVDGDVQTVEHEEEKEETWTKVVSKRRNKKPITLVGTSQQASELTGVKKAWIHLGKLKEGTTAENVETFLKKYFPELDVSNLHQREETAVSALSYRNKFIQLESITQEENYDVLCLSEHWMNEVQLQQYIPDGYNIASFFCRKTHHNGGVVIYIKQGWQYQEVCQITKYAEEMSCELAAIKVNNTIIVTVYRSPLSDWNVFMSNIENVFECINKCRKKAVIIGDFNIQFLGCDNKCLDFKNLCSTYGYKVTINVPTRLDSCIDNILISSNFESYQVGIINNHLSDHLAQFINFECNLVNSNNECKHRLTLTPITDNRVFLFNYLLSFVDFNQILSNNDLEKDFNCFINIILYYTLPNNRTIYYSPRVTITK
ncbi:hypothetical protein O3M35_012451 [Rhynocoris fuscipes]|uniref:Endonuclease/exonuclease/phosphatase domain-containing protein n=1 Tax=Rhynocoris fuscipes TaxID=488301 RepID=A0AAW1D0C3_9HEMI